MSDPRVVGLVCEGPTDIYIVRSIVQKVWPEVERVLPLQPELDALDEPVGRSGGWSEVKRRCEQNDIGDVIDPIAGDRLDALLLVIDVDIAVEAGIADPPASVGAYETSRLCTVVKSWVESSKGRLPPEVIIGIPTMATEAWIVGAIYRNEKRPEQIRDPAAYLVSKGKLRLREDGRVSKYLPAYRKEFAPRVASQLSSVRKRCPEADRLVSKLDARRAECGDS